MCAVVRLRLVYEEHAASYALDHHLDPAATFGDAAECWHALQDPVDSRRSRQTSSRRTGRLPGTHSLGGSGGVGEGAPVRGFPGKSSTDSKPFQQPCREGCKVLSEDSPPGRVPARTQELDSAERETSWNGRMLRKPGGAGNSDHRRGNPRGKRMKKAIPLSTLAALLLTAAFAQNVTSSLSGTILDQTGSAIPGAQCTLTDQRTGRSFTATSVVDGGFNFVSISSGTYWLSIQQRGMKEFTMSEIAITANEFRSLGRITLEAGAVTNGVDVTAEAQAKGVPLFSESRYLQFRWETFNTFNHTQFTGLNSTARFDTADKQIDSTFSQFTSAANPRIMQLSLRVVFLSDLSGGAPFTRAALWHPTGGDA